MPIPRMDNSPVHTTRVWTALRVRELPKLDTDALRWTSLRLAHSPVAPACGAFFIKNKEPGSGTGSPFPPGRQVAGARAPKGAQGAQPWGVGGQQAPRQEPP